ncbi:MAG: hypothetical protein IT204_00985 [Fimbriimonadaceae bacterium]|nr:hypothetical protein [Fimbriimonadaceae bacterium]
MKKAWTLLLMLTVALCLGCSKQPEPPAPQPTQGGQPTDVAPNEKTAEQAAAENNQTDAGPDAEAKKSEPGATPAPTDAQTMSGNNDANLPKPPTD